MRFDRILMASAVVLGVAAVAWTQQPTIPESSANPNRTPATGTAPAPGGRARTAPGVSVPGTDNASATVFVRATQVVGMEVRESTGQARIGVIADLLLTPNSGLATASPFNGSTATPPAGNPGNGANASPAIAPGPNSTNPSAWWQSENDVRFALIQIDNATADRVMVVPWDVLQFQGTYFVLGIPEARIAEAPSVMLNDPRILQSEEWLEQVGTFFANDLPQERGQVGVPGQPAPNVTTPPNPNRQRPSSRTTRPGGGARP